MSCFPDKLESAKVKPLYKKDDLAYSHDYRPITLPLIIE